jgi:hypothetical protein
MNVHGTIDVRQTEIHTAEPVVPELSAFESEMVIENLKGHKSPGIDQMPAEFFTAGEEKFAQIHKLINSVQNKEEMPEEWKEWIVLPFYKKGRKTDVVIIVEYYIGHLFMKFYPASFCQVLCEM